MSKNSKHFKGSTKMWPANAIVIILEFDWNRKWGPDISFFLGKKRVVQFVRDVSWATNVGVAVPQYCDKFRQNCVVILRPSTKYLRFLLRERVTTLVRDQRICIITRKYDITLPRKNENFFNVSTLYYSCILLLTFCIKYTFNCLEIQFWKVVWALWHPTVTWKEVLCKKKFCKTSAAVAINYSSFLMVVKALFSFQREELLLKTG